MEENNFMTSKEFISKIGVSMKKLETLEKEGIITPMRDGRIRYYSEEHLEQYNAYLMNSMVIQEPEKLNQTIAIAINNVDNNLIDMLDFCNQKNIIVDNSIICEIENDTLGLLMDIFEKIKKGLIGRIVYKGDEVIGKLLEKVCLENKIKIDIIDIEIPKIIEEPKKKSIFKKIKDFFIN